MTRLRSDDTADAHTAEAPCSHERQCAGRVAHDVLTQPTLLALVTSFQLGLPSVTGPLIAQYLRANLTNSDHDSDASNAMAFAAVCDLWDRPNLKAACHKWRYEHSLETLAKYLSPDDIQRVRTWVTSSINHAGRHTSRQHTLQHARAAAEAYGRQDVLVWLGDTYATELTTLPPLARFPTPMSAHVACATKWRVRVTAEAIATYDNDALDALRFVIHSATSQRQLKSERTRRHVVHRVWEAAATLGRVDILTWLYATQRDALVSLTALARLAASLAVRHGHVAVLAWLEATMGDTTAFSSIANVNLKPAVRHGYLELVRWMAQRSLGVASVGAAYHAVTRQHFDLLHEVLHFPVRTETTTTTSSTTPAPRFNTRQCKALATYASFTAVVAGQNGRDACMATIAALLEAGWGAD